MKNKIEEIRKVIRKNIKVILLFPIVLVIAPFWLLGVLVYCAWFKIQEFIKKANADMEMDEAYRKDSRSCCDKAIL